MSKSLIKNSRCLPYNPALNDRAGEMRNNSTKGEIRFWCELLRNKKCGYQFYGQKPIYKYIVDFYCAKLKLVIEIDGTSHLDKEEYDLNRDKDLEAFDLKIIHYDDLTVINNFHIIEKDFIEQIEIRRKEVGI